MDSLKKSDVKGKRVRVTDDSGCRYVGTVEYVDYQRGKLGITGAVEGSQGTKKSLQIFFRSDIKKIVVFDDNPTVFAQIPTQPSMPKTTRYGPHWSLLLELSRHFHASRHFLLINLK